MEQTDSSFGMGEYDAMPSRVYDNEPLMSSDDEREQFKFWFDNAHLWRDKALELQNQLDAITKELDDYKEKERIANELCKLFIKDPMPYYGDE